MKSKKVTMLAAALVVAVVAAAGIGYAINYTATTTNSGNSMESTYITMTQGQGAAYNSDFFNKIYFDTVTEKKVWGTDTESTVKTTYTPKYDAAIDVANDTMSLTPAAGAANAAYVSNLLTLTIAKANTTATTVKLDVTVSNFTPVTGLNYTMAIKSGNTTDLVNYGMPTGESQNMWRFEGVNIVPTGSDTSVTYEIYLFISMDDSTPGASIIPGANQNISTAGFNMPEGSATSADSVFTFVATATE